MVLVLIQKSGMAPAHHPYASGHLDGLSETLSASLSVPHRCWIKSGLVGPWVLPCSVASPGPSLMAAEAEGGVWSHKPKEDLLCRARA